MNSPFRNLTRNSYVFKNQNTSFSRVFANGLNAISGIIFVILFLVNTSKAEAAKVVIPRYPTVDIVIADFDVTDYGADSTGVNDATVAIQNAIDACYALGGGTVWVPSGTYKVSNTIYVKSFVTLRGDWRNPDTFATGYGTVISAVVPSGDFGPVLFQIGGSAGTMGLTIFYPMQNADNPVPYNFTFNLGGWPGMPGTYMANNVINCTMLNSYRGIGKCALDHAEVHECGTVRNVMGTVLFNGIVAFNSADVDTWSHINFSNSYWANAGAKYNAPAVSTLNTWTRTNGIAYILGDLEWDQFYDIKCSEYNIGINIVDGARIKFSGEFVYATILNTNIAVKADALDDRWGTSFLRCRLSGTTSAVKNGSGGMVKLTDCTLTGNTSGSVSQLSPGTSPDTYTECLSVPRITSNDLFDVTKAPYNAPYSIPQKGIPANDATPAIQAALTDAGNRGGGVVYLPAGWYKIGSHLSIPANVELRGSSSVPQLDQGDLSYGTTLLGYEGLNTSKPEIDAAMVTLNGNNAGISGVRFFYPNNNPANGVQPFPFTIRGAGSNLYLVNIGLTGIYNAVDFGSNQCDNHFIRNVSGAIYNKGIVVGASSHGWIENCLTNPAKADRCNYGISGWLSENNVFTQLIDPVTKLLEKHIIVKGASDEQVLNCFSYGANIGMWVESGTVNGYNFGTDNVGDYSLRVDCGSNSVKIMNLMRYNGTTSTGVATIYNEMHLSANLNPHTAAPLITSTPASYAKQGTLYTYSIVASGLPVPALRVTGNPAWMTFDGTTLSGTPPTNGVFDPITVVAANSVCPNASQTFTIEGVTPVKDYLAESGITIFPNPSSGIFGILCGSGTGYKIEISNILGEKVYSASILNPQSLTNIDLTSQGKGFYFMKVSSNQGSATKKLIVQ